MSRDLGVSSRLNKFVAWVSALALALGGLMVAQVALAPSASAWTTVTVGWDAVGNTFDRNTLYTTYNLWAIPGIANKSSLTTADMHQVASGAPYSSLGTIAVGPRFDDPDELAVYYWRYLRGAAEMSTKDGTSVALTIPTANWSLSNTYGGEMNQKTGQLYLSGDITDNVTCYRNNNNNNGSSLNVAIYDISPTGTVTLAKTLLNNGLVAKNETICRAEQRTVPGVSADQTWLAISDMAIDAEGNYYGVFKADAVGGTPSTVAWLVRVEPPETVNPTTKAGTWLYTPVTRLPDIDANGTTTFYGMAFLDGDLYLGASNGNIIRVNTLTGAKTVLLGAAGNSTVDFGAAQAAPVVRGKLYIDADGDGLISPAEQAAPGVAGATVGVYTVAGVRLGEVTTDQGGEYHALLPSATDDLYIRVQQPQIDVDGDLSTTADGRVNATQVYGYNWTGTDPLVDHRGLGHNKVVAMCRTASNDNVELAESGPCFGAKRSGVDASTTNNVLADAMFFSKVTMDQDLEVAVADFAFTAAGSFGDAGPAGTAVANRTRSTTGDLGPVHVNTNEARVTLGQVGGVYTDGVNDAASDAHASDDGVYLRLHNGSLASVQDQLLSVGRTYALEAHVRVAAGTAAVQNVDVSGWTSANNAANAMIPSSATVLGFGQPNDQGVSTASLTVPTAPSPTGGLSAKTLRVSASTRSGITAPDNTTYQYAPQPGGSAANTQPWVSDGEIEDYRYHVATGQVRVALVSLGGAVSNVPYTVSNAVGTAPSVSGGTLQTVAAGEPWTSTAKHAISNPGAATTLTLTQVPAGHTVVGGSCVDSISGADPWSATTPDHLPPADKPVVVGQSITIPANTYGTPGSDNFWNDLTCTLTIGKMPSVAASEFTLFPADGTAPVGADVTGTIIVRDPSDVVMPGVTVRLTSDDAAVTLKDANGQAITSCVTDNHGECRVRVSSDLVGTYADVVHATVQATAGGPWVEVGPPSDATKRSPKTVVFIAGALPDASQSEFTINEAGPLDAGQAYTLTVTAYDGVGQANSGKGNLVPGATIQFSADPVTGVTFAPQDGRCQTSATGRCSVTFTSTKAGQTHTLRAKVTDRQTGESTDVGGAGDPAKASPQTRAFKAGPPSSAHSSLSVDPESLPVGGTADVKVTLRDQHGNAVSGKAAALNVTATSGATVSATWTEAPAGSGVYLGTVASTTPGTYTVTAAPVGASVDDTVQFLASSSASAAKSTLLVGPAGPIKAGEDYTLTATLYDGVGSANSGRGNLVAGATVTFSVDPGQDFGSKGFSAWTCTSNAMGACQVTFSSSKPGAFNLHAKVEDRDQAGEPLTDVGSTSPQTRVVAVADVSAANSSLTVTPNAIVGEDAAVTLTLKDSFNNPVTGLTNAQLNASVTPPGAVLSPLAENPAGSGVYKGAVTSPTATTYTVSAQPSPLAQALTAQTEFTAASASYEQSRLVVTGPGPVFVGTGQANQYTLTVTAYDAGSNLVTSGQTFNFSTTPTPDPVHGPTLSAASCTSGADGTCSVTVTSEKAGTFDLHAMIGTRDVGGGGQPVQGSPQQRTWAPLTVVDASHSNIVLAKDSMAAGDQVVATITLGDQYGNPITGLTASSMTLSTDQAKTPAPTFAGYTDNGDGTYTVTVQGLVQAGTRTVAAAPGGVQVSDTIQVTASAIDPAKVTWAADPGNPATGQYKRVVLTVKDAFDNPIRGLTLTDFAPTTTSSAHPITLAWDGMGLDPLSPDLLTGQALGEYYWNLRGSLAKVYHPEISIVTATPNPIAKQTAIQVVNSGVGSATLEVVYPAGRTDGIVSYAGDAGDAQGHGVRVDVTVLDSGGAPISSLMASDFSWTPVAWRTPAGRTMDPARDWLVKPGSFTNLGDGKYTWWVASQRSGVYDAQALISGTVASSVADAKFAAAEPKNPGGVTFTICPSSTPCTDDNQDVVQAQPGQAYGFVDVTDDFGNPVELDDLSTANVNEATAAINDALTWTATPTTATPLTATTAWTAQRDGFGNRVGPYTARLAGATGITYTGNVTFTGVTGTDRVRFVAGAATRATLEFDVAEHQACSGATTAGECVQATVKVYDANDNAVTDLTDFTLTSNPVGVFVNVNDAQWAEVSPGAYVATVWATKAAQFYVRATTGSVQTGLTGLKFTPAEVCDPDTNANCPDPTVPNNQRTRLEITVNNAAADGAAKDRVTAHLFDTYGNQIAGAKIRSCAEGCAGVAVATSVIADTDSSGRSVIDYTATSGGAKSVTVQYSLDGGATWKHIRFVPEPGTTPPGAYTSSPATIDFTWRALPTDGTSTLTVTPNPAPAGTGLVARLVVKDAANHAVPGLGDVLTLSSPGMVNIPSAPTEWPVGTYTWNVDGVEAAGPYQAVVEDQGSGSATADYTLTQVASGANSSIAISDNGQGLQANNVDFYTVTVTLKDLTGVPITDGLANAPDGQPKLSLVGPANTDHTIYDLAHTGSGVYTAKVKASAAAAYTVTASYGRGAQAVEIGSVTAGFAKPTPAAANSSFVVSSGDRVVGSGQHTVTATLRNDQNQPVEIVPTQLDGSRALPSATVGAFAQVAGQPGVYRAPITATVAGLKTVEVQWADGTQTVDVAPATAGEDKVAFVAGPAVDPQDTFNVTTGNRLTNGTAFHEAWVMFADQHGNPRPGDSATFTLLDDAESGVATSGARFANADSGSFEVTVQADSTGRAAVKVYSRVPTPVGKTGFPVRAAVGSEASVVKYVPFSPETANPAHSSFTVTPDSGTKVADGADSFAGEIALRDANDLPVPGATASLAVCRVVDASTCAPTTDVAVAAPDGSPANLVASTPDGKILVRFTSVKAGAYQVTAKIGEDPIGAAAPYFKTVQFVAGPADATRSSLVWSAAPVVANGSDTNQVQALVKDAHGNIVADGTAVSFKIPGDVKAGQTEGPAFVPASTAGGYATVALTSVKAGSYVVDASVGGVDVTGNAPALPVFGNGPVSASESLLSITTTGAKTADGTQSHQAQVELKDARGNPAVSAATVVEFCWDVAGQTSPCQDATSAVQEGKALATYSITSLKAGTLTVTAKVKATGNPVSPVTGVTAQFVAGAPDPAASTLTHSQGRVTNNGTATHWSQALITDANGNPTGNVAVTFAVTGSAQFASGQATWTTGPDGKARVEVTDLVAETSTITATIQQGTVGAGSLLFGPGDIDPARSSFTVTPTTSVPVSDGTDANLFTATVVLRDSANAAVPGETVTLEFSGAGPALVGGGTTCTTDVGGSCLARVYSPVAGAWQVKATVDGGTTQIGADKPVTFTADDVAAAHSTLAAQSGAATADGAQTRWVEALIRDRFDNPVSGAAVIFTFPAATTLAAGSSAMFTGADGKARIELKSTTAGAYQVSAQAAKGGAPVAIAPDVQVVFQAGAASAANSSLTIPSAVGGATKVADGAQEHRAEVQVRDANNNAVGAGVAVAFTMTPPGGVAVALAGTTNTQGVAVAHWPSTEAGQHTVTATLNATPVGAGNGSTARFVPGPVDPARSTFQVTGDVVLNNGVNQHAATVIARDAHDNVIGSVPVELTVSEGEATIPGPVLNAAIAGGSATKSLSTDTSGSASSVIVSQEEGTFTVEAKIGSPAVSLGTKTVDFAPGSPSVANSSWVRSPAVGSVQVSQQAPDASYTVTVTVRSGNNLPVGDAPVRLSGLGGALPGDLVIDEAPTAGGYWTTGDKTSDHYGQVILHVRSAVAGDFPITAQILPDQWPTLAIPGSYTLSFTPAPPDPGQSTFTITPATNTVDEHATATFTIKDAHGNGIPGLSPTVDFIPPLQAVVTPNSSGQGVDGVYTWDVTSPSAATFTGTATLVVALPGTDIVKTAQVVFTPGDPADSCTPAGSTTPQPGTRIEIGNTNPVPVDDGFQTAQVTVLDARCNPVPGVAVQWTTDPELTQVADDTTTVTNDAGQAVVKVTSQQAGDFDVTAKQGPGAGTAVTNGSPAVARFAAGACVAAQSSFTVDRTTTPVGDAPGDGVVLTVVMRDQYGNACSDTAPTVQAAPAPGDLDGVTNAVVGSPVLADPATGTYTVTITDKAAETVLATVLSGSTPVAVGAAPATANPQPIVFEAEQVPANPPCVNPSGQQHDGSHIWVDSAQAVTADGVAYHDVTALVVDRFCNPIPSWVVDWATAPQLDQVAAETSTATDAAGLAKVRVTSTVAGSHEVGAEVLAGGNPMLLGGSPQAATFQADACDVGPAGRSSFDVDKLSAVAGSSDGVQVTMTLLDAQGNACALPSDATLAVTPVDSTTALVTSPSGSGGVYTSTVTDAVAETVNLRVSLGADDVAPAAGGLATVNPQPVVFTPGAVSAITSTWAVTPGQDVPGSVFTGTLTVKDGLGNPVPGLTDAQLALDAGGMQVVTGPVEQAPGVYEYTTTQTAAATYTLKVTLNNGTPTDTSDDVTLSDTATVTEGAIATANSHVTVSPASTGVGQQATVTVHVADGSDNPISNLTSAVFTVKGQEGPAADPATDVVAGSFVNQGSGNYTFQITSLKATAYEVHATVDGVGLTEHPTVEFTTGGVCVSNCTPVDPTHVTRVEMTANDQLADGVALDKAIAFAYDVFGNPKAGAEVKAQAVNSPALAPQLATCTTVADGTCELSWASGTAGAFGATVTIDDLQFATSQLGSIRFTFGAADPGRSTLEVSPASPILVGASYTLRATVLDAVGNPVPHEPVAFALDGANAAAATVGASCTTNSLGVCVVEATSKIADTYTVTAQITTPNGPAQLTGSPVALEFSPRDVCVNNCTPVDPTRVTHVEVTQNGSAVDGENTATVFAYDVYGNAVADAAVVATPADADVVADPANGQATGADGTLALGFTSAVAGAHPGNTVTVGGYALTSAQGSPFTLTWATGSIDPSTSTLSVTPAGPITVGSRYTLAARVADGNDNPVGGAAVTFLAPLGPAFVGGVSTCSTAADGTCSVELGSTLAGTFAVQAQVSGLDVTGSPKDVVFTAGAICVPAAGCTPDPGVPVTKAEVIVNGVQPDDTERDIVLVSAYDVHGNPVSGAPVTSAKVNGDDLQVQPVIAATDANGQTTVWYTSGTPGTHMATVTVGGLAPPGSPVGLAFGAGNGDPATSSFTVTPAGPLTVGETAASTYTVTTTVRDVFDDPAEGVVVTVNLDHAGPTWGPDGNTCVSGADGTCSVVATSTVAGTYGVQARLAAGTIGWPESRVWKADDVCGVDCTPHPDVDPAHTTRVEMTVDHRTADGDEEDVVTVFGFDQWGNPVEGAAVVPSTTDSDLLIKTGLAGLDASGKAELKFSSTVAGTHVATIQVDGAAPAGSPVAMHFDPGAVSVARSTVQVDPPTAGVGNEVTVTVHVADAQGNAVPGLAGTRFSVKGHEGASSDPATDITAGSFVDQNTGDYTFRLTSAKARQYGVHATLDGQTIDQHPFVTFTHGGVCVSNCTPTDPTHVTRVEMTVNNQLADGQAQDKAKFFGHDVFGNPVVGAVVEAAAVNSAPLTPQLATCTTGADGTCELAWASGEAGTYGATVTVGTLEFATSQLSNIVFTFGTADPAQSTLVVAPASPISVGSSYTLTATVEDAHGNPVPGETITFALEGANAGHAQLSAATCQTTAAGTCQVTLTSKLADTYTVTAKVTTPDGAEDIVNSPAVVGFEALGPCLADCTPVDPTHTTRVEVTRDGATVGENDEATVLVYDTYGNPVSGALVQATPGAGVVADPANGDSTDADGRLVLGFTSDVSGPHPGNAVTVAGGTPAGSPFSLTWVFGQIDVTLSTLAKSPAGPIVVDGFYTVLAHVVDGSGNPVSGAAVAFGLPAGPAFVGASNCVTDAAGDCTVQVTSALAGSFALTGTISGAGLTGSPLALEFTAGAVCVAPDCTADPGAPRTKVEVIQNGMAPDGAERDIAQVSAYDKHGNPVPGAPVTSAKASAGDDLTVQPVIAATGADGVSTVWYTSTTAGNHQAAVTVGGVAPAGSPVTLGFGAGSGDPATSSFTVSPAGPLTVGESAGSTYTVTTTVRDVFDAPVPGAVVTVGLDHLGPVFAGGNNTCVTDAQGVCSVAASSTAAGTYGFQPRVAAGPIGTAESRVWKSDSVCGQGCDPEPDVEPQFFTRVEVTVDNRVADGDAADVVTVYGFDKWGNPVEGAAVVPNTADPTLVVATPLAGIGADGKAELRFTSKVAGAHTAIAMVGGAVPVGSPMTLNFVPGTGCAAADPTCPDPSVPNDRRTRLEVTVDGQTADGVARDLVTAHVFDKFGNPVATAIRSSAPSEVTVQSPIAATSGATGATTIEYASETAGTFDVTVEFQRQGQWDAVTFKPQTGTTPPANHSSSPAAITFTAGAICVPSATEPCSGDPATQTSVQVTRNHQRANGVDADEATVRLFDALGNPVPGQTVRAVGQGAGASDLTVGPIAVTAADGTTVVPFTSLGFGPRGAKVTVVVAGLEVEITNPVADKSSPVALHFVRVDDVPAPAITSPADGAAVNDATPTFEGTGEPGAVVTITDGGDVIGQATVGPDGTWSHTPDQPLADGDHSVTATQEDTDGNTSAASPAVDLTVDTIPPEAPVVTTPADGADVGSDTPTVAGTAEPGSEVTVDAGGGDTCTATADASGDFSCTLPQPLPDGPATITVTATDPAGNASPETTVDVTVDTVAPSAPVVDSPRDGEPVNDPTPTVTGTAEPGSEVTVDAGGGDACTAVAGADGSFSCTLPGPLPDGPATITVTATDPAGNTSDPTVIVPVVDTDAPDAPTVTSPAPGEGVGDPTPTVEGEGEPGSVVTVVDDTTGETLCAATVQADGAWSCTVPDDKALADGTHDLQVTQTDPAGNESDPTEVPGVTIDTEAPDAPTVTTPRAGDEVDGSTPTVTGTGEPGATVEVVDQGTGTTLCTATVQADGTWSCTVEADKALADGPHDLVVTQTDPVGNESDPTVVPGVNIDTVAPGAPTVAGPVPGQDVATDTPVVTGAGDPGDTVTVVDQGTGETLCMAMVQADGTWSCTVTTPLADGPHDLVVTETDPAGNTSEPTQVPGVNIDTEAPDQPVVTKPADGGQWNPVDNPTVEGTAEPGSTVTVADGGGDTLCTATAAADGTFACVIPPDKAGELADGDIDLIVTSTDPAGNTSGETDVKVEVDTENPSTPTVDTSDRGVVTGTADPGDTVTITDGDGNELCSATAGADGEYSCEPSTPLKPGDEITVTAKDPAGNETSTTVRVLDVAVLKAAVTPTTTQTVTGWFFQPGELVTAAMRPGALAVGTATADVNGIVTFTWTIPADTAVGAYQVVLTGSRSGTGHAAFQVTRPIPVTGGQAGRMAVWASVVASLFGLVLIGLGWRRRREDEAQGRRPA